MSCNISKEKRRKKKENVESTSRLIIRTSIITNFLSDLNCPSKSNNGIFLSSLLNFVSFINYFDELLRFNYKINNVKFVFVRLTMHRWQALPSMYYLHDNGVTILKLSFWNLRNLSKFVSFLCEDMFTRKVLEKDKQSKQNHCPSGTLDRVPRRESHDSNSNERQSRSFLQKKPRLKLQRLRRSRERNARGIACSLTDSLFSFGLLSFHLTKFHFNLHRTRSESSHAFVASKLIKGIYLLERVNELYLYPSI